MNEDPNDPVLVRMNNLVRQWEQSADRRAIFLGCYAMMTANMLAAIQANEFYDPPWVKRLLDRFAEYYFRAVDDNTPEVWRIAFNAIEQPRVRAIQHLLLGVNAHINYDLIFALGDVLEPEWTALDEEQRRQRNADHCKVNQVIAETVDAVQDNILDRYEPSMELVDKAFGRLDEWVVSRVIAEWRDEVWAKAVRWVEDPAPQARQTMHDEIQRHSLRMAGLFLLRDYGSLLK